MIVALRGKLLLLITALLALLLTVNCSTAAARMFYLERPNMGLEFEYAYQNDENKTPTQGREGSSQRFLEGLSLASRGYVYHPALFLFEVELNPTWEQQNQTSDSGSESSGQAFNLDYGLDGTILQYQRVSLQLQARRETSTITRTLSPTTTNNNRLWGGTLLYKSKRLPTSLSYVHTEQEQQGFYSAVEQGERVNFNSAYRAERSLTSLNVDYDERERVSRTLLQTTQNTSLRLSNGLSVTEDRRVYLASSVNTRWTESNGETTQNLDLSELLNWRHTPVKQRLQINSNYSARYSAYRRDGVLNETIPLDANLTLSHRLYENLISSLRGNGGYSRYENGEESRYGSQLDFGYTRSIPWGQIRLNAGNAYQINDRIVTQDIIDIYDEAQILSNFNQTLLANKNIELDSIQVFTADKTFEYAKDFDYTLTSTGAFIQISRVTLGGAIADGETVLVSYRYRSDPSAVIATYSQSYGAGLSLGAHWTLNYQLHLSQEYLRDGTPPENLADSTAHSFLIQLTYPYSDTLLTLDEDRNATGSGQRKWKLSQKFNWKLRPNLTLGVGADYGESLLHDSGNLNRAYSLRASGQWQPRANQQWSFELFRNGLRSNIPDRFTLTGLGLFYIWRYALWSLQADYRYQFQEQPLVGQEQTLNSFNLRLTRALK